MQGNIKNSIVILGFFICLGMSFLGFFIKSSVIKFREYDRSVTVKGLSEHEYPADIVIWPIQFSIADNDLGNLYALIDENTIKIKTYLEKHDIKSNEISFSAPSINDKSVQQYVGNEKAEFRYTAVQTVTVYSSNIESVRLAMNSLSELGKKGIVLIGNNYDSRTEYIFTKLNDIKPKMIEEATREAREVAEKFAEDSKSLLGRIKKASQGQFTIEDRDRNNPHIKKIRVVSTVEYYLSD